MLDIIAKPFGILLLWLYNLAGNYGAAIFLFALVVKLIMLPFQMKSKKSMMRMSALNPQLQELQKRHEANPRKYQEEVSKLYKEEHVNPMSGCLWSLIPYPILLALYRAIRFPLTTMMGVASELLEEGGAILEKLNELGFASSGSSAYVQLEQSQFITAHFAEFSGLSDNLVAISYRFLGLDLGNTPQVFFWNSGVSWATFGLFLIPLISAFLSWLQMKLSQATNPAPAPTTQSSQQTASTMKSMNIMMPLISLWICFSMPAALGIYWISTSLLAIVQELILNKYYGRLIEKEAAERSARQREREAEIERRREETERMRAAGETKENANTSKKKQQARQKAELDKLKAAAIREERAAKRAARGLSPDAQEKPASQVGNRRYARGRAYVPDRYTNPEAAEEATARAAEASELEDESIDETVPDDVMEPAVTEEVTTSKEALDAESAAPAPEDLAEQPEESEAEATTDSIEAPPEEGGEDKGG
ncbi:MAG: YidC/Oxa1 family membrane protein insertase [Oscillospiraceae bacterium]|nr:YidC/Oxa1 family membrane protein insertase [Oscillospiraceae bacterium]